MRAPGAPNAAYSRYEPKSPSRRTGDQSDEKLVIVRGANKNDAAGPECLVCQAAGIPAGRSSCSRSRNHQGQRRPAPPGDGRFRLRLDRGSADLIAQLAPETRHALLRELFLTDDGGIGITHLRISIGGSDLSSATFSYDDLPAGEADPGLHRFDLETGDVALIPVLQAILAIHPNMRIIATPWSAPPWMKSNQVFVGGKLKHEYYQLYAVYIITYIKHVQSRGIAINAITPQNEPLNITDNPSMGMSAAEQADFVGHHLGPALRDASLGKVALFCYDHNCDRPDYPTEVLADVEARKFVTGVAWHLYNGKPQALSQVARKYPGIKTYLTEQYVGAGGEFGADLAWHVRNVLVGHDP
jgi:glucosylceramidase